MLARYKVASDQINLPLEALESPSEIAARSAPDSPSHESKKPRKSRKSPGRTSVRANRTAATEDSDDNEITLPSPSRRNNDNIVIKGTSSIIPTLLPAPVLKPTSYSRRDIYYNPASCPPSSPPVVSPERSPLRNPVASPLKTVMEDGEEEDDFATPVAKRVAELGESPTKEEGWENLTSSAVKGQAASGLLELMRGR
jgi:hypothetical protein